MKASIVFQLILGGVLLVLYFACVETTDFEAIRQDLNLMLSQQDREYTESNSGLYYAVIDSGAYVDGVPSSNDTVIMGYEAYLLDDELFDQQSPDMPITLKSDDLLRGVTEGLRYIGRGGKVSLIIPPDLAYDDTPQPGVPPESVVRFEVDLVEFYSDPADYQSRLIRAHLQENMILDTLVSDSVYYVPQSLGGFPQVTDSSIVSLLYVASTLSGDVVDESYATTPRSVDLSEAPVGITSGLDSFANQGRGTLYVPYNLLSPWRDEWMLDRNTPVQIYFEIVDVQ